MQLLVVLCISIGLFLFTFKSTQFDLTGFLMCLAASGLSGLRWSLTQKVAQKGELGKVSVSSILIFDHFSLFIMPIVVKLAPQQPLPPGSHWL